MRGGTQWTANTAKFNPSEISRYTYSTNIELKLRAS